MKKITSLLLTVIVDKFISVYGQSDNSFLIPDAETIDWFSDDGTDLGDSNLDYYDYGFDSLSDLFSSEDLKNLGLDASFLGDEIAEPKNNESPIEQEPNKNELEKMNFDTDINSGPSDESSPIKQENLKVETLNFDSDPNSGSSGTFTSTEHVNADKENKDLNSSTVNKVSEEQLMVEFWNYSRL